MGSAMNYLCFVDGLLEFASSDPSSFAHYQLVYAEEHRDADVQYLTLTDEEYDEMQQADAEWARLKKGPMGTVLTDEEEQCEE